VKYLKAYKLFESASELESIKDDVNGYFYKTDMLGRSSHYFGGKWNTTVDRIEINVNKPLSIKEGLEQNVTYNVRNRNNYTHPITKRNIIFNHEYFSVKLDDRIISSCIIAYPRLSPTIFTKSGSNAWVIYAGGNDIFTEKDGNFVKIFDVKSRKDGKGYGRLLFDNLKKYLSSKGINRIFLNVSKENKGAHEFYKKIGFEFNFDGFSEIGYKLKF
jgi:GNAT superfamily N-acetyltransferase